MNRQHDTTDDTTEQRTCRPCGSRFTRREFGPRDQCPTCEQNSPLNTYHLPGQGTTLHRTPR